MARSLSASTPVISFANPYSVPKKMPTSTASVGSARFVRYLHSSNTGRGTDLRAGTWRATLPPRAHSPPLQQLARLENGGRRRRRSRGALGAWKAEPAQLQRPSQSCRSSSHAASSAEREAWGLLGPSQSPQSSRTERLDQTSEAQRAGRTRLCAAGRRPRIQEIRERNAANERVPEPAGE